MRNTLNWAGVCAMSAIACANRTRERGRNYVKCAERILVGLMIAIGGMLFINTLLVIVLLAELTVKVWRMWLAT